MEFHLDDIKATKYHLGTSSAHGLSVDYAEAVLPMEV
jgi:hypothetical protein